MPQTAVTQDIAPRYPGRLSTNVPYKSRSGKAAAAIAFGLLLLASPTDAIGVVRAPANLAAADVDAIMTGTNGLSAVGAQTFDAADFDGVVGPGLMRPTRMVTLIFDAHADWNPTWGTFWGIHENGQLVSEPFLLGTSVTVQLRHRYRKAVKITIPGQTGAGGTFTVGYAANVAAAYVADPDAICVGPLASAAVGQLFGGAQFNGVIGTGWTFPAKQVTATFNNHGDWDATNMVIAGEDEDGNPQTDTIAIPNGGNSTVTSAKFFSRVTSCWIPAQTGANGTATIGYAADAGGAIQWGTLYKHNGVARYVENVEQASTPLGYPANYVLDCVEEGEIDMIAEQDPIPGAQVFVRIVTGGIEVAGHVRMDDDGGDCVPVAGAYFMDDSRESDGATKVSLERM